MNHEVLVLNSDYEPLNICNMRRAISLVFLGKVDVLHEDGKTIQTVSTAYKSPSVVRLRSHVRRPIPQLKTLKAKRARKGSPHLPVLRLQGRRSDGRPRDSSKVRWPKQLG